MPHKRMFINHEEVIVWYTEINREIEITDVYYKNVDILAILTDNQVEQMEKEILESSNN